METVALYREIGKTLRSLGAYRVVLLNSKVTLLQNFKMSLEIAVDGAIDIKEAEKICSNIFTSVDMKLIDLNDNSNNLVFYKTTETFSNAPCSDNGQGAFLCYNKYRI